MVDILLVVGEWFVVISFIDAGKKGKGPEVVLEMGEGLKRLGRDE